MNYEVIVVGAGASGIIAAITAAKNGKTVLLLEHMSKIALKLKASGGGRCNLTNTLPQEQFLAQFKKDGRFLQDSLNYFSQQDLIDFFKDLGVECIAKDGFRVFPSLHNSTQIIDALQNEIKRLKITTLTNHKVEKLLLEDSTIKGVVSNNKEFFAKSVIVATGGLGYPTLGANSSGYMLAKSANHTIVNLYPAMLPLSVKEQWVSNCRADTISKAKLQVAIKKYKKLKAKGDLIFGKNSIKGPVVLDFAREITPLLEKFKSVPLVANFCKGLNQEQIMQKLKQENAKNPNQNILQLVSTLLPSSLAVELCKLSGVTLEQSLKKQKGPHLDMLYKILSATPLTVTGCDGFKSAMVTRGGISLKEIDSKTMQSRLVKGLYFCGEILNIDGPCGGYNLQFAFSSGYLAGLLL